MTVRFEAIAAASVLPSLFETVSAIDISSKFSKMIASRSFFRLEGSPISDDSEALQELF